MRDFKGMKRQRGRNRGGGGGKPQQHNANRAFDSNGPEGVKVRGAAQSVFEKYQQLARDAASSGDRVLAENYLQHAEHYFRVLRAVQPNRPLADIIGRDQYSSGYDIDFEAEPEEGDAQAQGEGEAQPEGGETDGPREERPRFEGGRRDRFENRDRQQDRDRPDRDRQENRERSEPREGGRRDRWRERDERRDRSENRDRPERAEREPRDPLAVIEPQSTPLTHEGEPASPMLRGEGGAVSHAPAFLGRTAEPRAETPDAGDEPVKKPRRRRAPRSFEGGEGAEAAAPESEEA